MKTPAIALAAAFCAASVLPAATAAQEATPPPRSTAHDAGRALAEQLAGVVDDDGDGVVGRIELLEFAGLVFASMDTDEDGVVTLPDMRDWRFGMADIADTRGRETAFDATLAFVFDMFDRDDDGRLTRPEHETAVLQSALYADFDADGVLTRDEYLRGFVFNIAMRNALIGQP